MSPFVQEAHGRVFSRHTHARTRKRKRTNAHSLPQLQTQSGACIQTQVKLMVFVSLSKVEENFGSPWFPWILDSHPNGHIHTHPLLQPNPFESFGSYSIGRTDRPSMTTHIHNPNIYMYHIYVQIRAWGHTHGKSYMHILTHHPQIYEHCKSPAQPGSRDRRQWDSEG